MLQPGGYQTLYRLLTNQPAVLPRRLGSLKRLAPLDPPGGVAPQPASTAAGAERPDPVGTARTGGFQAPNNLPIRSTSAQRFVGRTAELQRLDDLLAPEGSRVFVTGLGGVGKSELAVQHAYDSLERYSGGILRLDAHQGLSAMASQVVAFFRGAFPGVALPRDTSPPDLLPFCWRQWPAATLPPEPVLLLLDDHRGDQEGYAVERQLCEGLPPRFRRLITQRETGPTGAQGIDLPLLRRGAALDLLMFQAGTGGNERIAAEDDAADGLCQEVGDLPLALVLLGARLAGRPDLPLALLLEELKAKGADAKALRQAHPELGAKRGVVEALLLSWEPLSEASKSLALLLGEMAAAVIPWQLVEACRLPGQPVEEGSAFGDQQAELLHAQLLERSGEGLYRLHPLVRQFFALQGRERPEETALWRKQLAAAMAAICRERIPQTLTTALVEELEVVLPHLQRVAEDFAGELSEEDVMAPYTGMGRLAEHQAVFTEALKWYELGVQKCEEKLGPEHPSTTAALNNLAQVLQATNHLEEAEPLMRQALEIDEVSYGPDHPNVARDLNNLAQLLDATNRLEEAEPLMRRALAIDEASYGPDHPNVARDLNNLGTLLQDTNRLEEAEPLMRRVVTIFEMSYGPNHPDVATALNNLGTLLRATNRLEEAEPLMRRALVIEEASYGSKHPEVASSLNNLAQLLKATNRLEEADPLMRRALAIDEASYGPNHPEVATALNNMAQLLKATNRLEEAEPLMRRALAIDEASYGPNHLNVARDLNNLGTLLQATKRLKEAEPLMRRALAIDEVSYGTNHPNVARDLNNLAQLLHATNRLEEAEPLMRRVVMIFELSYGPNHPNVATALNNLGTLLRGTNRLEEAEPLMRRALAIDEASYGPNHPDVAIDLNNLAQLLKATSRLEEAEPLNARAFFILSGSLGLDHPNTQKVWANRQSILQAQGLTEPEIQAQLTSLQSSTSPP
ncbi:MAG: tetratricopeptide repeat protein [Cyanobacteriota bacterium]|nr:tetratricopeptide repeat protein [Cyanobacteriota bacterium]